MPRTETTYYWLDEAIAKLQEDEATCAVFDAAYLKCLLGRATSRRFCTQQGDSGYLRQAVINAVKILNLYWYIYK